MGYTGVSSYLRSPRPVTYLGPFSFINAPANQTNVQLDILSSSACEEVPVLRPCRVVGLVATVTGGSTTGTITLTVSKAGADPGTDYDHVITNSASDITESKSFSAPLSFAAGDTIGMFFSTSADWNGTGGDAAAFLVLEH